MLNNRIKHYMDDLEYFEFPPPEPIDHCESTTTFADIVVLKELEAFINSVEDKVCEVMGEAFCDGKLFGINIMVNPETHECRIWRCDD